MSERDRIAVVGGGIAGVAAAWSLDRAGYRVELLPVDAQTGSGSQPDVAIESLAVAVTSDRLSADAIASRFRRATPPIIGRIEKDRFLLDLRTIETAAELVPSFS